MKLTPSSELLSITEEVRSEDQMMLKLNIFLNQLVERETPITSFLVKEMALNSATHSHIRGNFAAFYVSLIHSDKALAALKEAGYEVGETRVDSSFSLRLWNVKIA